MSLKKCAFYVPLNDYHLIDLLCLHMIHFAYSSVHLLLFSNMIKQKYLQTRLTLAKSIIVWEGLLPKKNQKYMKDVEYQMSLPTLTTVTLKS